MSFERNFSPATPAACRGATSRFSRRALTGLLGLLLLITATAVLISACSRSDRSGKSQLSKRVIQPGQPVPKGGGRFKVGNPYQVAGRWYYPKEDRGYDRVGTASWYGDLFHGRYTANGEIYDMTALSAAHPTLPMPIHAKVTNLKNGRSVVVRVNDRGPYAHDRIIDLSRRSADALGFTRDGTALVRVTYLGKAPLNGDDSLERRYLAKQQGGRRFAAGRRKAPRSRKPAPVAVASLPRRNPYRSAMAARSRPKADPVTVAAVAVKRRDGAGKARTTSQGLIFVQAGAFRSRQNADLVRNRLARLGPAAIFPAEIGGNVFYRVRLGPYDRRALADATLRKVVDAGASGARIVTH